MTCSERLTAAIKSGEISRDALTPLTCIAAAVNLYEGLHRAVPTYAFWDAALSISEDIFEVALALTKEEARRA